MAGYRGKRALDLLFGVPALVLSLPVQAVVALAVRRRLGSPVVFRQTRPGLGGEPFELRKFRTMRPVHPQRGWTDDASRLTPFGVWLRSTSLDELPTLWNVVRGDMSLVGPRPLLEQYLTRYSHHQARRHEVRPGMTGLAQVSGRNALTWERKLDLDVEYVDRCSPVLDAWVVGRTIGQVLRRRGIHADGQATMPEFCGSPPKGLAS
jgi:lipopolysaccharide/colanic/teichoic acid biosynthesis glycosyltransferase